MSEDNQNRKSARSKTVHNYKSLHKTGKLDTTMATTNEVEKNAVTDYEEDNQLTLSEEACSEVKLTSQEQAALDLADDLLNKSNDELQKILAELESEEKKMETKRRNADLILQIKQKKLALQRTKMNIQSTISESRQLGEGASGGGGMQSTLLGSKKTTGKRQVVKSSGRDIDILSIRQNPVLQQRSQDVFNQLGLGLLDEDSEEEDQDCYPPVPSQVQLQGTSMTSHRQDGKKFAKIKSSGMFAEAIDFVKVRVIWPQEMLGPKYTNYAMNKIKFQNLDSRMLCCGELEIIQSDLISSEEKEHRLKMLNDIMYNSAFFEWSAILRLHAATLSDIERGVLSWGDDTSKLEKQILLPHPKKTTVNQSTGKSKKTEKKSDSDKTWFCSAYNRNECNIKEPHTQEFNGKLYPVQHICGKCWRVNKSKSVHPETSSECPFNKN